MLLLVGCSNGRGSLDEGVAPPAAPAQPAFSVGGTISGLAGSGLVLQNNGSGDLAVVANGTFAFAGLLADGAAYDVTVVSAPTAPAQTCTIANGSGSIAGANVTNVAVTCATGSFAIRGTVSGLAGTGLVLENNGGDPLAISANGEFSFAAPIATGATYDVTVSTQPQNPAQSCTVSNGSGTMGTADVSNVQVVCATGQFSVGGTVSGLLGSGLVLQNNGGDDRAISGNGAYAFATLLPSGATYSVTVRSQPTGPTQSCAVRNFSGTVTDAHRTDVDVVCETNRFTIGGTTNGLVGSGLVLQLNAGNDLNVVRNGSFAFGTTVPSGTAYLVTVRRQPSNPTQVCSVANPVGVVTNGSIGNVTVNCTTNSFAVGGSVTGLAGSGLSLLLNGSESLAIASNGSFTFQTRLTSGSQYRVTVGTQPANPAQVCTVANGNGSVGGGDVSTPRITCSTSRFSIRGSVTGLLGSGLMLRNNGGDDITVQADGTFQFPTQLASGSAYNVTVGAQPANPSQACTVSNGSGTVGGADVSSITVSCSTSEFTVGGVVDGLAGAGLVLRNNGGDDLPVNANGGFTFTTALPSGASYDVTVAVQPATPAQTCTVANGSGIVGSGNVTNVTVSCSTTAFTVGGTVSNLAGVGLVLQNNGGDDLPIAANGSFTFPGSLASGSPYNVSVAAQPTNPAQTCTVSNGSGSIGGNNVTDVAVVCSTTAFTIGGQVASLVGTGLVLQNNGGDDIVINSSGGFAFPTVLAGGAPYSVTIAVQPTNPAQTCAVINGGGTVAVGNVEDILITCLAPIG